MDTDSLPPFIRFTLFRLRASKAIDFFLSGDRRERFRARGRAWFYGDIFVGAAEISCGLKVVRTGAHIRRSASDQCCIVLFHSGGVEGEADGVAVAASTGHIVVIDRSRPIRFSASPSRLTLIFIRRDRIAPLLPDGELPHGHIVSGAAGGLLADFMRALERQSPEVTLDEARHIEKGACQMVAACVAPSQERLSRATANLGQSWRMEAKRVVDRELHDPDLGPEHVAKLLGLSRSKLYRLFEAEQGGVSAFIRRRRLLAACRLFLDPNERRRVSDIAFACGFKSETHFSRAFREEFNLSPSSYRELRGAASLQTLEGDETVAADVVHNWLTQLD